MPVHVSAAFDGGNIEVVDATRAGDLQLEIRPDHLSDFLQWFYFRVSGVRDQDCLIKLVNAGDATYQEGFRGYRATASYDRQHWFRVPTDFDDGTLSIRHRPAADAVYYAYFAPYSMERHADLVARVAALPGVVVEVLGSTVDGQDLDLLVIGEPGEQRLPCWVIARQHPGETMAEWWMEGFLERLTDGHDPVARRLRQLACFYVVPNMNPDGSRRGHLRSNALGVNLNREWQSPSLQRSPEVYLVRERMAATGVRFAMDVHGDEGLPYNFIAGFEGIPSLRESQLALLDSYRNQLAALCPDFQTEHGYPRNAPGKANLSMCTNYLAETYGCLAITLEQPFKDSAITPDERWGWSPERCRSLAGYCLDALNATIDRL
jgi:murein tripeptide amidase MpaA